MTDLPHGLTMLLLTDAESRTLRKLLENSGDDANNGGQAYAAFNRGITRGTERMAADFKARADAKKAGKR